MTLVWKLLRQHISVPQLAGFFLANLCGLFIVLLAFQFYKDIIPVFTGSDSFMKTDYLMVSKQVGALSPASASAFTPEEEEELRSASFAKQVGAFTAAAYPVRATITVGDTPLMNTDMPIESVPDGFVEVSGTDWSWTPDTTADVPLILPRSYITMYNFGFARSRSLPRISEGMASAVRIQLHIEGRDKPLQGRVVAFTSKLDAILVPQAFIDWSNSQYGRDAAARPNRLLVEVGNPTDPAITTYLEEHGLELQSGSLDAEKTAYFLRLIVTLVIAVGLVISLLSLYILMLSVYLLVEKNMTKLENLLLIGYSPAQVARPYALLAIALSVLVLLIALLLLWCVRRYYIDTLSAVYADLPETTMLPSMAVGMALLTIVSLINYIAIYRKIILIWKHKN